MSNHDLASEKYCKAISKLFNFALKKHIAVANNDPLGR